MKKPTKPFEVIKKSGERALFSLVKLKNSLRHSGASESLIEEITGVVYEELYDGISTKEIYNRAFALLKKQKGVYASKYKLKKAIYELGPTGFPFEKFIASILHFTGYEVETGVDVQGKCVMHEVDVVAKKNDKYIIAECKFHGDEGRKCDVKVPLYIHSRYRDILNFYIGSQEEDIFESIFPKSSFDKNLEKPSTRLKERGLTPIETSRNPKIYPLPTTDYQELNEAWVVTNTRFSKDALDYGNCVGLFLLSWDYPKGDGLKDRVDRLGLYPVTASTLLSQREKQFLLSRDIVLCRQLIDDVFYLDHLGISDNRKKQIFNEINSLCKHD